MEMSASKFYCSNCGTECNLMCFFDESLSVRAAVAKPKARKENQTKHYPKLNDFSWVVFCIS